MVKWELHGHKKKYLFFLSMIEKIQNENHLSNTEVSILEIGCSNGENLSIPFARLGYPITGIDTHQESIDHARKNSPANANFICGILEESSPLTQFDVVILSDVLEHVSDPKNLVRISKKFLNPKGIILISIPNGYGPYELEQRLCKKIKYYKLRSLINKLKSKLTKTEMIPTPYNIDSGHIQFFLFRDIQKIILDNHLEVIRFQKGSLFGGDITYPIFNRIPFFPYLSLILSNILPKFMVSTWYFACKTR